MDRRKRGTITALELQAGLLALTGHRMGGTDLVAAVQALEGQDVHFGVSAFWSNVLQPPSSQGEAAALTRCFLLAPVLPTAHVRGVHLNHGACR